MAKMDFRKIRNEYIRRSMRYADGVRLLYDQALSDIAREFALVDYNPDVVFSFAEYGKFGRVDSIMTWLEEQIQAVIDIGIGNEFRNAYKAHEQLLRQVLGQNMTTELERAFAPRITSGNAAKLYISETASNNITRSMRVWNGATLGQMETAVQEALMEGMPAKQMAGLIEQYLNDPESCFRRFRIKTGVDADGKTMYGRKWKKRVRNDDGTYSWFDADPRDYPTGQGVYHSSYKNALRYTRTTTNIAYRTADYERYQTEDFVLGIEIHTTSNPTHKEDICDFLAGRYPKDFKWTGWHPNCMCYEVPILATPDEVNAMADAIMNDKDPSTVPVAGRVTDVPDNFKEWVADNQDRIQETIDNGKQLPYFLRDNGVYINDNNSRLIPGAYSSTYGTMDAVNLVPTEKLDLTDVRSLMSDFAAKNPQYFTRGFKGIEYAPDGESYYMSTDIHGTIFVNFAKKDGFDAGTNLVNAVAKIKNGLALNENEEYAMEALWHEILHNTSMNTSILPAINSAEGFERLALETVNQLYARSSYVTFLDKIGVKALHRDWIMENGYSYGGQVRNLRSVIQRGGINEQSFLEKAYDELMGDYKGMDKKIEDILVKMNKDALFDIARVFERIELKDFFRFL